MYFEEKQQVYANLLIRAGMHLRKGQKLYLRCPVECFEFGRMVIREAYKEGAQEVITEWTDDQISRMKYENAPVEVFESYPEWNALKLNTLAKTNTAFLMLTGSDPEAMKGVDISKMKAFRKASYNALRDYYRLQSTMGFKWCVAGVPTKAWAEKVYPGMNPDTALTRLWDAVFSTVFVGWKDSDEVSAYEHWMLHADELKEKCEKLNAWQFKTLHYENSLGTDFTVGLVKDHRWEGGADTDKADGGRFFANMPTEEVFTMPDNRIAEGTLVSSMPLSHNGVLIDRFRLTFREGKVVDFDAEKGKEALESILDADEGSRRLGECALVPYPSLVSAQGILFLETLYDENAACHFALGACYETNLKGGENMSEEELSARGANQSLNHVDFMVGTSDLKITGTTWDGQRITVFENGSWAFS